MHNLLDNGVSVWIVRMWTQLLSSDVDKYLADIEELKNICRPNDFFNFIRHKQLRGVKQKRNTQ